MRKTRQDVAPHPSAPRAGLWAGTRRLFALPAMLVLAATGSAAAHAFPRPYDLPLPLGHYLAGSGGAVALSFVAAAGLVRRTREPGERTVALARAPTEAVLAALRLFSVALFVLLVAAGLFGEQGDWDRNILPVAVWVVWWVGMTFVCALAGNLWALVNPWAAIGGAAAALAGRAGLAPTPLRLPVGVGVWPAVALFLLFAWVELVWPSNAVPARLACAILVYSAFTFAAMALFGVETWLERGEVFARIFALFGRFAPLTARRGKDGRPILVLRSYGMGLASAALPSVSLTVLVITVLATVSFDGFSETPLWERISAAGVGLSYRIGLVEIFGYVAVQSLVKTAGLLAAPLAFAALYLAACKAAARLGGGDTGTLARRFVLSLVPIAIGYHVAHYFSYLVIQGQMIVPLTSDPFGIGWNLFGAAGRPIDTEAVDMRLVWIVAVAGIVAGHAAAVLVAHRAALSAGIAVAAQMPLLILMVGYTMSSLWILSQPIVSH